MNKKELIDAVQVKLGGTKLQAESAINAFVDAITEALGNGEKVGLSGFGTFEVRERAERNCVNPQNRAETIVVPATKVPAFKAGKALKEVVKNG